MHITSRENLTFNLNVRNHSHFGKTKEICFSLINTRNIDRVPDPMTTCTIRFVFVYKITCPNLVF